MPFKIWYFIATLIIPGPIAPDGLPVTSSMAYHFESEATCERIRNFFAEFALREPDDNYRWSIKCLQMEIEKMEEHDTPNKEPVS